MQMRLSVFLQFPDEGKGRIHKMFWDNAAPLYDLIEYVYNGKVIRKMCRTVTALTAPHDTVLECACGTGIISKL